MNEVNPFSLSKETILTSLSEFEHQCNIAYLYKSVCGFPESQSEFSLNIIK